MPQRILARTQMGCALKKLRQKSPRLPQAQRILSLRSRKRNHLQRKTARNYVLEGMPFRDAYKQVGLNIEAGKFVPVKKVHHTHEGSIGNLCNDQISALMQNIMDGFAFNRVNEAEQQLLS